MKKSVLISMLFLVGIAVSVAAGSCYRPPAKVVDLDVGQNYDSGIFKVNHDNTVFSAVQAGQEFQIVTIRQTAPEAPICMWIEQSGFVPDPVAELSKGLIKEHIHILNCSVRQCS